MVLAARDESDVATQAQQLGLLANAASVNEAVGDAEVVAFAVWLYTAELQ